MTPRVTASLWAAAVALLVAVTTFMIARWGVRVHTFNPDELLAVFEGRHVQDAFPGALVGRTARGVERLPGWMFAFSGAVTSSSASAFWLARVLWALSFAAAAPVVYVWGRLLDLPRALSFACAALAVWVPWMAFGTALLDIVPAWSLVTLALLMMWRALVAPSATADMLAILAVVVAALARVGVAVIGVALPLGAIVLALVQASSIRESPRILWRDHKTLIVLGAVLVVLIAALGTHTFIGGYPVRHPSLDGRWWAQVRIGWEQVGDGVALIPVLVTTAWVLRSLVRPTDLPARAFALVLFFAFLALSYAALTQAPEERYIAELAPMVAVGFGAALWRREAPAVLVGLLGLLMARVFVLGAPVIADVYGYQSNAAATWMHRVIVGRASLHLSFLSDHAATVVALGLAAVAVAVVLVRRSLVFVTAVVAACAVFGLIGGNWAMKKLVNGAGRPDLTSAQVTWLDRAAGNTKVGLIDFEPDPVAGGQFSAVWRDVQIFNPQVDARIDYGSNAALTCCGYGLRPIRLRVDPQTGRISSSSPLPKLLASINAVSPYGLPWHEIAASDYLPSRVSLGRLTSPYARFAVVSGDPGGHLSEKPIVLRVFRPGPDTCGYFTTDPPNALALRIAGRPVALRNNTVHLRRFAGRPYVDLALSGAAPARLTVMEAGPCPTR